MKTSLLTLLIVLAIFGNAEAALERSPRTNRTIDTNETIGTNVTTGITGSNGTTTEATNTVDQSRTIHDFIEMVANAKWYQNVSNMLKQMIEDHHQDGQRGCWSIFSRILYFGRMSTS